MSLETPITVDGDKETRTQRFARQLSKHAIIKVTAERVTWFHQDGSVRSMDTRFAVELTQLTESGNVSSNNRSVTRDELRDAAATLLHIADHALVEGEEP